MFAGKSATLILRNHNGNTVSPWRTYVASGGSDFNTKPKIDTADSELVRSGTTFNKSKKKNAQR